MRKPRIAPGEWAIMQLLWERRKAQSVREVMNALYPNAEKAYTTVQTVMNNLEQKGFLKKEKLGLVNFYKPVLKRKETVKKETKSFVTRVFNGSFNSLANYLIESDSLTPSDIAQLKEMIDQKEKEQKGT